METTTITAEQIQQMPAGDKMDLLVHDLLHPGYTQTGYGSMINPVSGRSVPWLQYSADIAAAWQVVDAMTAKGCICDINYRHYNGVTYFGNGTNAMIDNCKHDASRLFGHEWGETAPLAICRAALVAMLAAVPAPCLEGCANTRGQVACSGCPLVVEGGETL